MKKTSIIYNSFIKRIFDFIVAIVVLIVLSPLFLFISLMIKLDSKGPMFFKQERVGYKRKVFKIIKFRTMVVNAESKGDGLFVYSGSDSRITKIGSFLRKTSLDELPQLLNVIMGHMSLVGPRPPVTYFPYEIDKYSDKQSLRFRVRPGITGLSQIVHRTNQPWDIRIKTDIEYYNKLSFMNDLKIIFKTFILVLKKTNIYPESKEKINNSKGEEN